MPNPILDAVNAELAKLPQEPAKQVEPAKAPEERPIEENKSNKEEKPIVTPEAKPEEKKPEEKEDYKPVELDKKFKPVSYERFKDVNDKYKKLKDDFQEFKKNKKDPTFENDDEKEAHQNFKKMGFQTKDDIEEAKFTIQEQQIRQEEQQVLDKEVRKLEREFDGTDGLPAFKKDEVLNRGIQNQVFDPKSAYIVMNLNNIVNHLVKQQLTEIRKQPTFGKSNDIKSPDIAPKEKLDLKGNKLHNFLTDTISTMLGK